MFLSLENIGLDAFMIFTELKQNLDFSEMAANLHKLA